MNAMNSGDISWMLTSSALVLLMTPGLAFFYGGLVKRKNTVNTIPPETLNAYRSHGEPALRIEDHIKKACWVMSELTELGVDIDTITNKLESDGVEKFIKAFDKLMETLTKKSFEKK